MFKRIRHKLHDDGGVTILMALFAMLVAAMVCIVILTAAVTTTKLAKDAQQQEQDTLILQSAARLVAEDFADATVTKTVSYMVNVDKDNKESVSQVGTVFAAHNCMIPNSFKQAAQSAIEDESPNPSFSSDSFTIILNNTESEASNAEVKNTVKVDYIVRNGSYNETDQVGMNWQIIFTFSLMNNDGSIYPDQQMFLKMAYDKATENRVNTGSGSNPMDRTSWYSYDLVTTYKWKNPVFYTSED